MRTEADAHLSEPTSSVHGQCPVASARPLRQATLKEALPYLQTRARSRSYSSASPPLWKPQNLRLGDCKTIAK
jgi:hypothetical protein